MADKELGFFDNLYARWGLPGTVADKVRQALELPDQTQEQIKEYESITGKPYVPEEALVGMDGADALKIQRQQSDILSNLSSGIKDTAVGIGNLPFEIAHGLEVSRQQGLTQGGFTGAVKQMAKDTKNALLDAGKASLESFAETLDHPLDQLQEDPLGLAMNVASLGTIGGAVKGALQPAVASAAKQAVATAAAGGGLRPAAALAAAAKSAAPALPQLAATTAQELFGLPIGLPLPGAGSAAVRMGAQAGLGLTDMVRQGVDKANAAVQALPDQNLLKRAVDMTVAPRQYLWNAQAGMDPEVARALSTYSPEMQGRLQEMDQLATRLDALHQALIDKVAQARAKVASTPAGALRDRLQAELNGIESSIPALRQKLDAQKADLKELTDEGPRSNKVLAEVLANNKVEITTLKPGDPKPAGKLSLDGTKFARDLELSANSWMDAPTVRYLKATDDNFVSPGMLSEALKDARSKLFAPAKVLLNAAGYYNQLVGALILSNIDSGVIGSAKTALRGVPSSAVNAFPALDKIVPTKLQYSKEAMDAAKKLGIMESPDLPNSKDVRSLAEALRDKTAWKQLLTISERGSKPLGKLYSVMDGAVKSTILDNTVRDIAAVNGVDKSVVFKAISELNTRTKVDPRAAEWRALVIDRVQNIIPNYDKVPILLRQADKHMIMPFQSYNWANINTYQKALGTPTARLGKRESEDRNATQRAVAGLTPDYLGGRVYVPADGSSYTETKGTNPLPVGDLFDLLKIPSVVRGGTNMFDTAHPQRARDLLPSSPVLDLIKTLQGTDVRTNKPLQDEGLFSRGRGYALLGQLAPTIVTGAAKQYAKPESERDLWQLLGIRNTAVDPDKMAKGVMGDRFDFETNKREMQAAFRQMVLDQEARRNGTNDAAVDAEIKRLSDQYESGLISMAKRYEQSILPNAARLDVLNKNLPKK